MVVELEPGLRLLRAPNPSPMTEAGTNTYLLGRRGVAVIDPGPEDPAHVEAILKALPRGGEISHIVVTHAHRDHSPAAALLAARTGAHVLAFGDAAAGRRADLAVLAGLGGGEGVDADFTPDLCLADGAVLAGEGWSLTALHTPGHMGNHLCLAWGDAVFSGDHVMGWASTMVSPPDGDLSAFMASLDRLAQRVDRVFYPGHGAPVSDPAARIAWLARHRRAREAQILAALAQGPATPRALTRAVYTDVAPALLPAAERNVLAHLIDLMDRNRVSVRPNLALDAEFSLC